MIILSVKNWALVSRRCMPKDGVAQPPQFLSLEGFEPKSTLLPASLGDWHDHRSTYHRPTTRRWNMKHHSIEALCFYICRLFSPILVPFCAYLYSEIKCRHVLPHYNVFYNCWSHLVFASCTCEIYTYENKRLLSSSTGETIAHVYNIQCTNEHRLDRQHNILYILLYRVEQPNPE